MAFIHKLPTDSSESTPHQIDVVIVIIIIFISRFHSCSDMQWVPLTLRYYHYLHIFCYPIACQAIFDSPTAFSISSIFADSRKLHSCFAYESLSIRMFSPLFPIIKSSLALFPSSLSLNFCEFSQAFPCHSYRCWIGMFSKLCCYSLQMYYLCFCLYFFYCFLPILFVLIFSSSSLPCMEYTGQCPLYLRKRELLQKFTKFQIR